MKWSLGYGLAQRNSLFMKCMVSSVIGVYLLPLEGIQRIHDQELKRELLMPIVCGFIRCFLLLKGVLSIQTRKFQLCVSVCVCVCIYAQTYIYYRCFKYIVNSMIPYDLQILLQYCILLPSLYKYSSVFISHYFSISTFKLLVPAIPLFI